MTTQKYTLSFASNSLRTVGRRWKSMVCAVSLLVFVFAWTGCGETAKIASEAATNTQVNTYFTGQIPAITGGISGDKVVLDHSANTIVVSYLNQTIDTGTFVADSNGFTDVSINAAVAWSTTGGQYLTPQNPPVTGASLMEIPGVGAVGTLYSSFGAPSGWVPVAMASSDECPTNTTPLRFVYVMTPYASVTDIPYSSDPNNKPAYFYGTVDISAEGATIEFNQNYYTVIESTGNLNSTTPTNLLSSGGCADTILGHVISYPTNRDPSTPSNAVMYNSAIAKQQFLSGGIPGVYNVLGIAVPSSSVAPSALSPLLYRGLLYDPSNYVSNVADHTTSFVGFGDLSSTSATCSALASALPVSAANVFYGGEYPNGNTSGTENCDIAVDLGTQDSTTNGLFPNAKVYLAPTSLHNATSSLVTDAAVAVAGPVDGHNAIFVTYFGGTGAAKPLGIYLFQKN